MKVCKMSSRTYICINCRFSKRAEANHGLNTDFRCPTCHGKLWELEWKWRIPKKNDDKGWKELREKVINDANEWIEKRREIGLCKIEDIKRLIEHYSKQRDSEKKLKKLKSLYEQIESIKKQYL